MTLCIFQIEASEKEDSLKGDTGFSVEEGTSDKLRALEIAHKCAVDENKRLRDEVRYPTTVIDSI